MAALKQNYKRKKPLIALTFLNQDLLNYSYFILVI